MILLSKHERRLGIKLANVHLRQLDDSDLNRDSDSFFVQNFALGFLKFVSHFWLKMGVNQTLSIHSKNWVEFSGTAVG